MNKKLAIFAIILIIIGSIGTIGYGVASIPYFIDKESNIRKESNKEYVIYSEDIKIDKLNVNTKFSNVTIKTHNENKVIVTKKGNENDFSYDIQNIENQISIIENENKNQNNKINNLNELTDYILRRIYQNNLYNITIYIPNNVDINVSTETGSLNIEDNIILEKVVFKTLSGNISLPKQVKKLDDLKIISKGYIQLSMSELLGVKNVFIDAYSINVYSDQNDIFIDNMENYIPNNIYINQENNNYGNVNISTDIPVALNLNIEGEKSNINLDIPVEKYKMNFNARCLEIIDISSLVDKNIINENDYLKYKETRQLSENLNKNLDNNENEYKINVKSQYLSIN